MLEEDPRLPLRDDVAPLEDFEDLSDSECSQHVPNTPKLRPASIASPSSESGEHCQSRRDRDGLYKQLVLEKLDIIRARRSSRSPIEYDHSELLRCESHRPDAVDDTLRHFEKQVYRRGSFQEIRLWGCVPSDLFRITEKSKERQGQAPTVRPRRSDSQIIRDLEDKLSHDPTLFPLNSRHRRHVPLAQRRALRKMPSWGSVALEFIAARLAAQSPVTSPTAQTECSTGKRRSKGDPDSSSSRPSKKPKPSLSGETPQLPTPAPRSSFVSPRELVRNFESGVREDEYEANDELLLHRLSIWKFRQDHARAITGRPVEVPIPQTADARNGQMEFDHAPLQDIYDGCEGSLDPWSGRVYCDPIMDKLHVQMRGLRVQMRNLAERCERSRGEHQSAVELIMAAYDRTTQGKLSIWSAIRHVGSDCDPRRFRQSWREHSALYRTSLIKVLNTLLNVARDMTLEYPTVDNAAWTEKIDAWFAKIRTHNVDLLREHIRVMDRNGPGSECRIWDCYGPQHCPEIRSEIQEELLESKKAPISNGLHTPHNRNSFPATADPDDDADALRQLYDCVEALVRQHFLARVSKPVLSHVETHQDEYDGADVEAEVKETELCRAQAIGGTESDNSPGHDSMVTGNKAESHIPPNRNETQRPPLLRIKLPSFNKNTTTNSGNAERRESNISPRTRTPEPSQSDVKEQTARMVVLKLLRNLNITGASTPSRTTAATDADEHAWQKGDAQLYRTAVQLEAAMAQYQQVASALQHKTIREQVDAVYQAWDVQLLGTQKHCEVLSEAGPDIRTPERLEWFGNGIEALEVIACNGKLYDFHRLYGEALDRIDPKPVASVHGTGTLGKGRVKQVGLVEALLKLWGDVIRNLPQPTTQRVSHWASVAKSTWRAIDEGSWYQESYDAIITSLEDLRDLDIRAGLSNRLGRGRGSPPYEATEWYEDLIRRITQLPELVDCFRPQHLYGRFNFIKPRWQRLDREIKITLERMRSTSDGDQVCWMSCFHRALEQFRSVLPESAALSGVSIEQRILTFEQGYHDFLGSLATQPKKQQQTSGQKITELRTKLVQASPTVSTALSHKAQGSHLDQAELNKCRERLESNRERFWNLYHATDDFETEVEQQAFLDLRREDVLQDFDPELYHGLHRWRQGQYWRWLDHQSEAHHRKIARDLKADKSDDYSSETLEEHAMWLSRKRTESELFDPLAEPPDPPPPTRLSEDGADEPGPNLCTRPRRSPRTSEACNHDKAQEWYNVIMASKPNGHLWRDYVVSRRKAHTPELRKAIEMVREACAEEPQANGEADNDRSPEDAPDTPLLDEDCVLPGDGKDVSEITWEEWYEVLEDDYELETGFYQKYVKEGQAVKIPALQEAVNVFRATLSADGLL